jgi:hypothetical protein
MRGLILFGETNNPTKNRLASKGCDPDLDRFFILEPLARLTNLSLFDLVEDGIRIGDALAGKLFPPSLRRRLVGLLGSSVQPVRHNHSDHADDE